MLKRVLAICLTILLLAGCLPRLVPITNSEAARSKGLPTLRGTISDFLPSNRAIQSTNISTDFVGAVVSVMELSSGITKASGVATMSNGVICFSVNMDFTPVRANPTDALSVPYYIEAVRGVKGQNTNFNQAGSDAMRLRNVFWYDFTNSTPGHPIYKSIYANEPAGTLNISRSTTTVAMYLGQKILNGELFTPTDFAGCIDYNKYNVFANPAPYTYVPNDYGIPTGTPVGSFTTQQYNDLALAVYNCIQKDQDPIHALTVTAAGTPVNTTTDFSVLGLSASSGRIYDQITVSGNNFDVSNSCANIAVQFVGAQAAIATSSCTASSLAVTVPEGARSGPIGICIGGVTNYSSVFAITNTDGHRATFRDASGNTYLYAVTAYGSLVRVNPDNTTTTLYRGFTSPTAILVNPEKATAEPFYIYVADHGTGQIVKLRSDGTLLDANFIASGACSALAVGTGPSGTCGDLYHASDSNNWIRRTTVDWAAGTVTTPTVAIYLGLTAPTGLAFDPSQNLYVVQTSQDMVRRFTPASNDNTTYTVSAGDHNLLDWASISGPKGIAIDTAGNSFISSYTNNVIYKVNNLRVSSAWTGVSGATSISRDDLGNLYVGDQTRSLVRRITLDGNQRILAYGLASPVGIAVDSSKNVYVALSNSGAILRLNSDGITTSNLISGIAQPYILTYRNSKIYVSHTANHNATEVDPVTGSARSVIPSGLHWPGGVEVSADGLTYYVAKINRDDSGWYVPPGTGHADPVSQSGVDVVTNGGTTFTTKRSAIEAVNDWGDMETGLAKLDADRWIDLNNNSKKLFLITRQNGADTAQLIQDVTPSFGGTKVFPAWVKDAVYDGSRYIYCSCDDGIVYCVDSLNWGAAEVAITGVPHPYGLTYLGGILYVTSQTGNRIYRVTTPSAATAVDGTWNPAGFGNNLKGVTNDGVNLFVASYNDSTIYEVTPAGAVSSYATINAAISRIRAYNNGNLVVRSNDGYFYQTAPSNGGATGSVSPSWSTVGCTGCSIEEFEIDGSNNVYWVQPSQHWFVNAHGICNAREVALDPSNGNLYVAGTMGVTVFKGNGDEVSIKDCGTPYGLAVNPSTHELYILSGAGYLYSLDTGSWTLTTRSSAFHAGWGLDYDSVGGLIYAVDQSDNRIYSLDPANWAGGRTMLQVGLVSPLF